MSIIDRFLLRQVMQTLGVVLLILFVVLFANYMVGLLSKVAAGSLDSDLLFAMMGYQMVRVLGQLLPAAFFFAVLWVLSVMYRDNEMVALQGGGVGVWRIYRASLLSALPVVVVTTLLSIWLAPWASAGIERLKLQQVGSLDISGIKPAKFNEFQRGDLVIYTESISPVEGHLLQVFVQHRQQGKLGVVSAERAYITQDNKGGGRFVVLADGVRYEGIPGNLDYQVTEFSEYAIRLPEQKAVGEIKRISAKSMAALLDMDTLVAYAELHYRISLPLSVLAFAILVVPLARSQPRKDIYGRITLAILAYFIFSNLQRLAERWLEQGIVPEWLGLWWVPLLVVAIAGLVVLLDSYWLAGRIRRLKGAHV